MEAVGKPQALLKGLALFSLHLETEEAQTQSRLRCLDMGVSEN